MTIKIKALEWEGNNADSICGPYTIVKYREHYGLVCPEEPLDGFRYSFDGSLEECRSAAQEHFEARILSVITDPRI